MMKKYLAEFIGTFALVFCGTGAIIINEVTGGAVSHVGIALTFGLIVLAMIYAVGEVSGANINPAVTFGFWLAGRLPAREVLPFVGSQTLGAILASATLKLLFPDNANLGATLPAGSPLQSFVIEIFLMFFLMFVIINVSTGAKEKGITAGIAVSSVVALEALFAGPITGASMNPARSLAPALLSANLNSLWVYVAAPLIGAGLGVWGCKGIKNDGCCTNRKEIIC